MNHCWIETMVIKMGIRKPVKNILVMSQLLQELLGFQRMASQSWSFLAAAR